MVSKGNSLAMKNIIGNRLKITAIAIHRKLSRNMKAAQRALKLNPGCACFMWNLDFFMLTKDSRMLQQESNSVC